MVLELETGGNVRFEDGVAWQQGAGTGAEDSASPSPTAATWVHSCVHFLHTHLASPAMARRFGLVNSSAASSIPSLLSPSSSAAAATVPPGSVPLLRIRRLTKIHNRALRNRFEDALERRMEESSQGSGASGPSGGSGAVVNLGAKLPKPELHYAFWSGDSAPSAAAGEGVGGIGSAALIQAANDGFVRPASSRVQSASQSQSALQLSNSVLHSDLTRLTALARGSPGLFRAGVGASSSASPSPFAAAAASVGAKEVSETPLVQYIPGGEIMIAKVFLGQSVSRPAAAAALAPEAFAAIPSASGAGVAAAVRASDFPPSVDSVVEEFAGEMLGPFAFSPSAAGSGAMAVGGMGSPTGRGVRDDDEGKDDAGAEGAVAAAGASASPEKHETKLKRIHVFDRRLVLPEYIVSYDYVIAPPAASSFASSAMSPEELQAAMLYGAPAEIEPELLRLSVSCNQTRTLTSSRIACHTVFFFLFLFVSHSTFLLLIIFVSL
jgi:hypothetical protein